ncbi:hypothetical protein LT493_08465 [Streptomyces tricolor]|nr:hypothetical protein [Streptomyces tricolor]
MAGPRRRPSVDGHPAPARHRRPQPTATSQPSGTGTPSRRPPHRCPASTRCSRPAPTLRGRPAPTPPADGRPAPAQHRHPPADGRPAPAQHRHPQPTAAPHPPGTGAAQPSGVPQQTLVSGTTRLYAVLGDPVGQVQSPGLLNPLFAHLGIDAVLVPVHVRPADLETVVRGLQRVGNLDGLFVTVPHKTAAALLADRRSRTVRDHRQCQRAAPRTRRHLARRELDGSGFVAGLVRAGARAEEAPASRWSARAAPAAPSRRPLLDADVDRLTITDPDTPASRPALVDRLAAHWPGRVRAAGRPPLADSDLAVNATPLGLRPDDPLPFAPQALPPGAVVADIIMKPPRHPAVARGRRPRAPRAPRTPLCSPARSTPTVRSSGLHAP